MDYKWLMVPHGMLEPWSMQQKWFKKWLYFSLVERRLLAKANVIRAVGSPEFNNLQKMLSTKVVLIPNGIPPLDQPLSEKPTSPRHFLFMARLHHKKGLLPMVQAWLKSSLANNNLYLLTIAGPDDGELPALKALLASSGATNIQYVGAVYGEDKEVLLQRSHFYLLPSFSEGFPTSLLEAMQYGLIPLMTSGCNFPEALKAELAIAITPEENSILQGLNLAAELSSTDINTWGQKAAAFVNQNYNLNHIAELQYKLYRAMLEK
jgi:glycosyltransferase involved in cell wall biosynthesis